MYITRSVSLHCKLEWKSVSARYICKYSPQSHTLNILLLNLHFFHSNMQSRMSKWRALCCPKCLFMSQWLDWKSLWRRYVARCVYKKIVNNYFVLHLAVCTPPCQHGGRCTAPGQCQCAVGWRGHRCSQGMHRIACMALVQSCLLASFL